jgi:hypothetical protein
MEKTLLFVYNADNDIFSQIADFAHKIFSPQTYQCQLCALTFGNLAMKSQWKEFLKTVPFPKTFLHREEFLRQFPEGHKIALPAIFLIDEEQLSLFLTAEEIKSQDTLDDLIVELKDKIKTL